MADMKVGETKIGVKQPAWIAGIVAGLVAIAGGLWLTVFSVHKAGFYVEHVGSGPQEHAIVKDCFHDGRTGKVYCGDGRNALTQSGQSTMLSAGLAGTWYVRLFAVPAWSSGMSCTSGNLVWNNKVTPPVLMACGSTATCGATNPTTITLPAGTYTDGTCTFQTLAIPFAPNALLGATEQATASSGYPGTNSTTFGAPSLGSSNCAGGNRSCYQSATSSVTWTLSGSAWTSNLNMAALCTTQSGTSGSCVSILALSAQRSLVNSGDQLSFTDTTYQQ